MKSGVLLPFCIYFKPQNKLLVLDCLVWNDMMWCTRKFGTRQKHTEPVSNQRHWPMTYVRGQPNGIFWCSGQIQCCHFKYVRQYHSGLDINQQDFKIVDLHIVKSGIFVASATLAYLQKITMNKLPYPRALTCMHLYLKMHLVFENRCMHLYLNTKHISSKRHALIFEHEITLIIKKWYIFQHKKWNR